MNFSKNCKECYKEFQNPASDFGSLGCAEKALGD